ncbi:hypothetical protein HMSSN036_73030 [Paenibacillus macerans]|nr:hypothetical protein HMSSN036_73030 [Paenibacillus macerans]
MRVKLRSIPFMYKLLGSVLLLVVCFVISMLFGAQETAPHELWLALTSAASEGNVLTLQEIRLPRELAAMLVGAALAVSGAIMQGVTRNPLADPGLLGLTSGANLALAVIFACIPGISYFGIMLACFIGAPQAEGWSSDLARCAEGTCPLFASCSRERPSPPFCRPPRKASALRSKSPRMSPCGRPEA